MTQLRLFILLALILAIASPAIAQNTLVSATITDAGGQAWVSGTYTFTSEAYPSIAIISGTLDATGSFTSVSFPTNNVTAGVGGRWRARICPAVTAPCYGTSISVPGGSTLSLTSALTPPAIAIDALKPPPLTAYTDSEIINSVQGSRYFNVTDNTEHVCKALPCSSNWQSTPNSGASNFSNINGIRLIDGTKFTTCNAAVADLGSNPGIVIIPSAYAGAECTVTPDNITLWDFRAGSSRMEQGVHYRVNDSSTHIRMLVADLLNASNLTSNQNHAELYGKVNYNGNPTGGNQVVEAVTGLAGTDSAISGNFPGQIIGVEGTGDVAATGGFTVGTVKGGTFNTTLSAGNTNVSQMFSLYAQAPTKIGTGIITQAASFVAEDPCVGACPASTVNLSGWFLGDTRIDKHISQAVAPSASIGHFSRVSNFTGVGQQGMFIAPTFSSGATTEGEAIMARSDLVAASFVQAFNANFYSANPVFGSGSSATNHYGYYAEPQTSGVTNYSYYAAGTEASFFGGPIQHGEIAAPSGIAGKDICYGDSTAHALECSYNNGTFGVVPLLNRVETWTAAQSFGAGQVIPTSAGLAILGTTALPIGVVQIGTAATNNFALTPSATGQATAISMLDPKAATAAISWQGGIPCTNGELALSAGWGTTATVTAVVGLGWSCEWTITSSGTGQAAVPTITDTLVLPVLSASIACEMRMVGGTGTATLIDQTTLSATAPVFTFGGTPVAASTYKVYRRC